MLETEHSGNALAPGFLISNRYEIVKRLGTGGMGSVYLALDRVLENGKVAIKLLHPEMSRDPDIAKRFLREVALMNKVNHPNVVRTFDVGRDNEMIYFTMEYVSGTPLDSLARKQDFEVAQIVNIALQVGTALQAIHSADIIHRDLKPANIILLSDKTLKLADFGVARPKGSNLTQHDEIIGSVEYMAPEIWLGKDLSVATDFYSFGIILYELATKKLPFEGDQPAAMMWLHVKRPPNPPKTLRQDLPNWLNQLILKLLAKTPSERPKSAAEIVQYISSHAQRYGVSGTGSFPVVTGGSSGNINLSGTHQSIGSGRFPSVTTGTGNHPSGSMGTTGTHGAVRRTSSRVSKKQKLRQHKRLIAVAVALVSTVAIYIDMLMAFYKDLFPY